MKVVRIIGAGMAGLFAGNLLKRSGYDVTIFEKQKSLPNNHSAVLRFRSPNVGDALGISFKPVLMAKASLPWRNPIADALAYANKCSGVYRADRSLPLSVTREERWIAPPDFIQRMAQRLEDDIEFDSTFAAMDEDRMPTISTIPMPILAQLLNYPHKMEFQHVPGINGRARIKNCEAYVSLYVSHPEITFNRISLTGNELVVEYSNIKERHTERVHGDVLHAAEFLGIENVNVEFLGWKPQQYAKIQPIDNGARKRFIAWATDNYNIFSFGRFAIWKPGLLLDDLIDDIRKIERWLEGDRYAMRDAR